MHQFFNPKTLVCFSISLSSNADKKPNIHRTFLSIYHNLSSKPMQRQCLKPTFDFTSSKEDANASN